MIITKNTTSNPLVNAFLSANPDYSEKDRVIQFQAYKNVSIGSFASEMASLLIETGSTKDIAGLQLMATHVLEAGRLLVDDNKTSQRAFKSDLISFILMSQNESISKFVFDECDFMRHPIELPKALEKLTKFNTASWVNGHLLNSTDYALPLIMTGMDPHIQFNITDSAPALEALRNPMLRALFTFVATSKAENPQSIKDVHHFDHHVEFSLDKASPDPIYLGILAYLNFNADDITGAISTFRRKDFEGINFDDLLANMQKDPRLLSALDHISTLNAQDCVNELHSQPAKAFEERSNWLGFPNLTEVMTEAFASTTIFRALWKRLNDVILTDDASIQQRSIGTILLGANRSHTVNTYFNSFVTMGLDLSNIVSCSAQTFDEQLRHVRKGIESANYAQEAGCRLPASAILDLMIQRPDLNELNYIAINSFLKNIENLGWKSQGLKVRLCELSSRFIATLACSSKDYDILDSYREPYKPLSNYAQGLKMDKALEKAVNERIAIMTNDTLKSIHDALNTHSDNSRSIDGSLVEPRI